MTRIVLITGKIGSGKDVCAQHLCDALSYTQLSFADPLKSFASLLFQFPTSWAYSREGKEQKPHLGGGLTVGQILQRFGTEVGRSINPNLWVDLCLQQIARHNLEKVVISDCRYENEYRNLVLECPCLLIALTRDAEELVGGRDSTHASEDTQWWNTVKPHIIDNAHISLFDTFIEVERLVRDWESKIKPEPF